MPRAADGSKLQFWKDRLDQFSSSQRTIQQFCESVGCSVATFYYWKRKVAENASLISTTASRTKPSRTRHPERPSAFVPVVVRTGSSLPISVRLTDGTRVVVPADALAALDRVLEHAHRVAS